MMYQYKLKFTRRNIDKKESTKGELTEKKVF